MAVMDEVIKIAFEKELIKKDGRTIPTLCFWSDGAPSYKCCTSLSFCALDITHKWKVSTECKYGCEYHLKSQVDSWFGLLERRIKAYTKHHILSTVEGVAAFLERSKVDGEIFKVVVPTIHKNDWVAAHKPVRPQSLPLPVKSAYCFKSKLADDRGRGPYGRGLEKPQ